MKTNSSYAPYIMLPFNKEILESCSDFSCGDDELDNFFHNDADLYSIELMGKTYCWITNDKPHQIVALFTLANDSIKTFNLNNRIRNKLNRTINNSKRGRSYPAVLIGRLGINKSFQNKSIGSQLLYFIKDWFRHKSNKTGCDMCYSNSFILSFFHIIIIVKIFFFTGRTYSS